MSKKFFPNAVWEILWLLQFITFSSKSLQFGDQKPQALVAHSLSLETMSVGFLLVSSARFIMQIC